jgi:hypothetical protein
VGRAKQDRETWGGTILSARSQDAGAYRGRLSDALITIPAAASSFGEFP